MKRNLAISGIVCALIVSFIGFQNARPSKQKNNSTISNYQLQAANNRIASCHKARSEVDRIVKSKVSELSHLVNIKIPTAMDLTKKLATSKRISDSHFRACSSRVKEAIKYYDYNNATNLAKQYTKKIETVLIGVRKLSSKKIIHNKKIYASLVSRYSRGFQSSLKGMDYLKTKYNKIGNNPYFHNSIKSAKLSILKFQKSCNEAAFLASHGELSRVAYRARRGRKRIKEVTNLDPKLVESYNKTCSTYTKAAARTPRYYASRFKRTIDGNKDLAKLFKKRYYLNLRLKRLSGTKTTLSRMFDTNRRKKGYQLSSLGKRIINEIDKDITSSRKLINSVTVKISKTKV